MQLKKKELNTEHEHHWQFVGAESSNMSMFELSGYHKCSNSWEETFKI
jgi:hypothetical protein